MIDSTVFMADIPAAAYTVGQTIPLAVKYGPAAVRSGYGKAVLKEIVSGNIASGAHFEYVIQNSNMIDPIINSLGDFQDIVAMDEFSTMVQQGNDYELEPNSTWVVYAKCVIAGTTTAADTAIVQIDIDYPEVAAVENPLEQKGIPTSIEMDVPVTINAAGSSATAGWDTINVDILKPGYKYLLEKVSFVGSGTVGLIAFANAAAQNGLSRVIPVCVSNHTVNKAIKYAAPLTKGPQDIKFMMFAAAASTGTNHLVIDYVKRQM